MARTRQALTSDDWLLEQQIRAEIEAEAWRRLREQLATAERLAPAPLGAATAMEAKARPTTTTPKITSGGGLLLNALVRLALAGFGSYLAYLAAADGGLGEFEAWLAAIAGFLATLSVSMFEPVRRFVHFLAETTRWAMAGGVCVGLLWLLTHQGG